VSDVETPASADKPVGWTCPVCGFYCERDWLTCPMCDFVRPLDWKMDDERAAEGGSSS
jgi:hypothetical protein